MKKLIAPIAAIIILAGGIGYYAYNQRGTDPVDAPSASQSAAPVTYVSYKGVEGSSALSLLQASHAVELKRYSFGDMVQSIDGTANTDQKSWILYVNGAQSAVGADAYTTKSTDQIEWKFEEIKF